MYTWYIEGQFDKRGTVTQQKLSYFPQVLGRDASLDCTVVESSVSRKHAQLAMLDGVLTLTDLNSRNGTFVNRTRVEGTVSLCHGDVIHLGDCELRILDANHHQPDATAHQGDETAFVTHDQLSQKFPFGISFLEQLLAHKHIQSVYQPIIRARDRQLIGYELLGRGAMAELPRSPLPLFELAESFGLELELSELMRTEGVISAAQAGLRGQLLVNTHPRELADIDRLLNTLYPLRQQFPNAPLTLEIHEHAVTDDISKLRDLKTELQKINIALAFDDFGVGQSRLLEMIEAKPDLIKFDKALIENIDNADQSRLNLVTHLKNMVEELGIHSLAECVSNEAEFTACERLGFDYYQGYFLAMPEPLEYYLTMQNIEN